MQIANVWVALGGDKGTTVPKNRVTVSEIAVLRAIHGNDAVFDIEPCGEIERSDRAEIARLHEIYSRTGPQGEQIGVVKDLFPGIAARTYRTIDELSDEEGNPLPETFFKPIAHAKAEPAKPAKKAKGKAAEPVDPVIDEDEQDKLFD